MKADRKGGERETFLTFLRRLDLPPFCQFLLGPNQRNWIGDADVEKVKVGQILLQVFI